MRLNIYFLYIIIVGFIQLGREKWIFVFPRPRITYPLRLLFFARCYAEMESENGIIEQSVDQEEAIKQSEEKDKAEDKKAKILDCGKLEAINCKTDKIR